MYFDYLQSLTSTSDTFTPGGDSFGFTFNEAVMAMDNFYFNNASPYNSTSLFFNAVYNALNPSTWGDVYLGDYSFGVIGLGA